MLSCKDVTYLASDFLDKNIDGKLSWKIRLHLIGCRCCRRFIKHLKLTTEVVPQFVYKREQQEVDAAAVLKRIKEQK